MIRREHIKQAIDAISGRDPEIGYSLDEMFGIGLIDAFQGSEESSGDGDFCFLFEGNKVTVRRFLFFQEGTAPIEQALLIKYGEIVKRQEIQERSEAPDYTAAFMEVHAAGLRLVVRHEIDYALSRLKGGTVLFDKKRREGTERRLKSLLERIKAEDDSLIIPEGAFFSLYKGVVGESEPALFMCFPFCMSSLMQVADMNLEFFHVRFLLNCLIRGLENNLLACVVRDRIQGLVFLTIKKKFLKSDLEIKYIATTGGKGRDPAAASPMPLKGIGTFLVAGVWMMLKNEMSGSADIILDAEAGARGFYESMGFEARGFSGFLLRRPRAPLFQAILRMGSQANLRRDTLGEIAGMIRRQIKGLRRRPQNKKALSERRSILASIKECLGPHSRPEFTKAAVEALKKYRRSIPEWEELLRSESEQREAEKTHVHETGAPR